jgi:hypothetical protein
VTFSVPKAWLPDPEDERLHLPTGDESLPWKDTWYFSLRDDASDQTLNLHMTVSANRTPPTRVGVSVAHGAKFITEVMRNEGSNTGNSFGNELAHIEVVHLSGDSDHELLMIGNLDAVSFELTVKGKHYAPLWDTMFPGYYATGKFGHQYSHYEQLITGTGWVQWAGRERVPFSGGGWRDRGWGRRKTELTFNTGIDLIGAILPDDSVFSLIALRSNEVPKDDPMPIAGWRSAEGVLVPAVGGLYYKDAMAWPSRIELEFLDGYRFAAHTVRRSAGLAAAWHDAEPEVSGYGHNLRDYYAVMADESGAEFTVFSNHGNIHKVNVFLDAEFKYISPPVGG